MGRAVERVAGCPGVQQRAAVCEIAHSPETREGRRGPRHIGAHKDARTHARTHAGSQRARARKRTDTHKIADKHTYASQAHSLTVWHKKSPRSEGGARAPGARASSSGASGGARSRSIFGVRSRSEGGGRRRPNHVHVYEREMRHLLVLCILLRASSAPSALTCARSFASRRSDSDASCARATGERTSDSLRGLGLATPHVTPYTTRAARKRRARERATLAEGSVSRRHKPHATPHASGALVRDLGVAPAAEQLARTPS